ncbi:Catalase (KatE) (PDB:6RJR) [Commensalibacter communis]|uniref:Catalase n=1 Tax=Commensalibacter communis TaxID=2972786 RepID=A0A9W4X738_9PROT|nr:catalase [Commensalibacter communis]CAI3949624.1 Catalase (KatE) (PDB:6RJR) [Commensalibacter communis]CAI3953449.1 Catalase (KatE) (PDB:6RJR) [Commensalibacter communis]CAI3953687.1 Catalase (KatE) (PDB:6RJR) [Commensalibacter communis]CAI3956074.1 Catalase (KatE) (PDB:6RJR) [Commensalibacter communis]
MSKKLTGASGTPIADNQNSRSAGPRGPVLIDDFHLIEKLAHFNRENIPERRVHAKGAGAHGTFTVTKDISKYTSAKLFDTIGKKTPILSRFSTVGGERGSADTARDPRGFSLKFYTEEGNWDIVGNNTPVFFIRDAIKFPDFIHTQKRVPQTNLKDPNMMWDFFSLSPEALHQVTILFSDRGIPDGFRFMHGYGSHTYSLINKDGVRTWVKWHFRTQQGIKNLDPKKAAELDGSNPDYATEDLFNAIEKGDYPKWGVYIQIMTEEQAKNHKDNPFDVTKVWSQREFPLHEVGFFELNRNPENYFAEIEQAAFAPSNVIPGTGLSPDKMLQGRVFAYADAQRYRIGTNYQQLPINAPKCPYANYQRDGAMRFDSNGGSSLNYEPNSDPNAPKQTNDPNPLFPADLSGAAGIYDNRTDGDYYSYPAALFKLMNADQKELLINNIAESLQSVKKETVERVLAHFVKIDPEYGNGIAKKLNITLK